ncbi:dephospho-CoA kinase [Streptomyces sp. M19]
MAAVVEEFGPGVLTAEGTLDRPGLGAIVFNDPERLRALNAIVHPGQGPFRRTGGVGGAGRDRRPRRAAPGGERPGVAVRPGPGRRRHPETQLDRLTRLRGMTEDEARSRMAAQATRQRRLAAADLVVRNDGPLEELEPQVRAVWAELAERAGRGA